MSGCKGLRPWRGQTYVPQRARKKGYWSNTLNNSTRRFYWTSHYVTIPSPNSEGLQHAVLKKGVTTTTTRKVISMMTMTIIMMMSKTNKNFNTRITYVKFSLPVLCPPLTFSVGCHMLVPTVFVYTSSWLSYTILIWTVIKKNEKTKTKINYLFHVIENNCQRSLMGLRSIHNYSITI